MPTSNTHRLLLASLSLLLGLATAAALLARPTAARAGEAASARAQPETKAAWEARLAALEGLAPAERAAKGYRLALEIQAAGYDDLAERAFGVVLAAQPNHPAARRALGYEQVGGAWLRGDALYRARGFVHLGGRWLTAQEFTEATRPQREAAEQKAGEARVLRALGMIASEKPERVREGRRLLAVEKDRYKLAPLAKALRCRPVSLRLFAAGELGRMSNPLAVPAMLRRAIDDPDAGVRKAVAQALAEIGSPSTVHPLGRALESRYAKVRVRAAEALAVLGDELAVPYVITKWEKRSGDFPRAYFAHLAQVSYIQDFDVEVAQTSFIADPVVGVLQEGVVLPIKIQATEQTFIRMERPAFVGALKKLTGQDFGDNVRAWDRWWRENEPRLLEERAQRYERRAEDAAGE